MAKISDLFRDAHFLQRLVWGMSSDKAYIVCPYIPPRDQARFGVRSVALSEFGDFNSVYEVSTFLRGVLNCAVEFVHSRQARNVKDLFSNHVVIVGGPAWNKYARQLMEEYGLPFQYRWSLREDVEDSILDTLRNREWYANKSKKGGRNIIEKDYGILAILPNKHVESKVIVWASGITSTGGLGAVRAFTEGPNAFENLQLVARKVGLGGHFIALVESDVRWGEFPYPKRISDSEVAVYRPSDGSWQPCA